MALKNSSVLDISVILNDYSEEVKGKMIKYAKKEAQEGCKELKVTSPKTTRNTSHRGQYAKGWRVKTESTKNSINCIIHNKTDYQLTHLLEKPHATHNGGYYRPKRKHIEPVDKKYSSKYENDVIQAIKEG